MLISTFVLSAQESRKEIKDYVNTEIFLENSWAGESMTLVKENKKYYIIRKIFGSGIPIVGTIKYLVTFNSDYQIEFSQITEVVNYESESLGKEEFMMSTEEDEVFIYLNGLKLVTKTKR